MGYVFKSIAANAASGAINGTINNTTTGTTLTFASAPTEPVVVNEVLGMQSEYLRVTRVLSGTVVEVERGFAGSTPATQSAQAVRRGGAAGAFGGAAAIVLSTDAQGRYVIPTAGTYTNTTIGPLAAVAINYWESKIGSGVQAVDTAGGGVVILLRPYSAAGLTASGVTVATSGGTLNNTTNPVTFTTNLPHTFWIGQVLKVENEYLRVVDTPSATTVKVSRGFNGSSAANHADSTAIYEVPQFNASYIANGGAGQTTIATEWSGGKDALTTASSEFTVAYSEFGGTSFTVYLPAAAKGARADLFDSSAKGTNVLVAGGTSTGPSCALSLGDRRLVVTQGSTAFASGDVILVKVWY